MRDIVDTLSGTQTLNHFTFAVIASETSPAPWARANAVSGDTAKAKSAYLDFLALWKDADIPVLKGAKAEYAKIH
jgi:hypothetical protein